MGLTLNDVWGTVKDAGSLSNSGADLNSLSKSLFGDNALTSSLTSLFQVGGVASQLDAKKMQEQRAQETQRINESNTLKTQNTTQSFFQKNWKMLSGGAVAFVALLFFAFGRR